MQIGTETRPVPGDGYPMPPATTSPSNISPNDDQRRPAHTPPRPGTEYLGYCDSTDDPAPGEFKGLSISGTLQEPAP
ncbi:hypothetical protein L873DRAFT_1796938 [Choiromyces venosus 120613-1]|uniref:Uncharacterized protein n=1 Tax=Choiromyces venosus 120613-1 TaxID=1336337 RepID=A0A3N4K659_9PEZI|nr:hypothetical protein L873DRAFT_1796938 [Choiromyces venosus 120613-1]